MAVALHALDGVVRRAITEFFLLFFLEARALTRLAARALGLNFNLKRGSFCFSCKSRSV